MKRSDFFKSLAALVVAPLAIGKAIASEGHITRPFLKLGERAVSYYGTARKGDLIMSDTGQMGYVIDSDGRTFTVIDFKDRKQYFRYNKTYKVFANACPERR